MRCVGLTLLFACAVAVPVADLNPEDIAPKNSSMVAPVPPPNKLEDVVGGTTAEAAPNMPDDHYPVNQDHVGMDYSIKEKEEVVAAVPVLDPKNTSSLWGTQPEVVKFNYTNEVHPMEEKTPLNPWPCDPDHVLDVKVPAAEFKDGNMYAELPGRYGCSGEYELGREKASPQVFWDNVADDVIDFSLQLVSMGGADCPGTGEDAGKILWHVTGIQSAHNITLQEGASHDSRLLFGGKEQPNQWLEEYYSGPCPRPGAMACYRFKVLAHRKNGWCQCGHQDVLFLRPDKIEYQPWTYTKAEIAAPGKKN
jgi:phosphatidylethanolamine-binding protein (PEBP) family uncharacterized protein